MEKKYSIQWQGDEVVAFEVDGVQYSSLDEVPDEADRDRLLELRPGPGRWTWRSHRGRRSIWV